MKNKKINPSPYPSSRESEYGKENAKFSEPGSIKPKIIKNPIAAHKNESHNTRAMVLFLSDHATELMLELLSVVFDILVATFFYIGLLIIFFIFFR